jgi:iron complex outermembrane recepter protein
MKRPLLFLMASLPYTLLAGQNVTLQPLSVSAGALQTNELRTTDAVSIYTSKDIKASHAQNLYQFFNEQTAVTAMPSYGNPFSQLLDIHGYGLANGNENIVVMLNGQRLNDIDSIPQQLAIIPISAVKRIEIIRSGGIVTAGDGANAGVINIITKQNVSGGNVTLYGGNFGTADGSFSAAGGTKKLFVQANGETRKTDGIRAIDNMGGKDANKFTTGNFRLTYTPVSQLKLHLGAHFSTEDVTYASYLTQKQYEADPAQKSTSAYPSTQQRFDTNGISAGLTYYITDHTKTLLSASHEKKKSLYIYVGATPYYYDYNTAKFSFVSVYKNISLQVGYAGFFGKRNDSDSKTYKDNNALFIQTRMQFGKNSFKAGYRIENLAYRYDNSTTNLHKNDTLNGAELGYSYLINKTSSVFANFAHSYEAPDIDKFFVTTYPTPTYTPTTTFNNFIAPMQANSFTLGYNNITPANKFKISAYYIALINEIYLYSPDNYTFINTNIDKSHKYGVDFLERHIFNTYFSAALHYSYVQAIIDKEQMDGNNYAGKELPGVSHHNVKVQLCYKPNLHTSLTLSQIYRSWAYAQDDFNNDFSQKQRPYTSTNLTADYAKNNYELFAKINNLFNQKNGLWIKDNTIYPVDFTTTVIVGLKLKF